MPVKSITKWKPAVFLASLLPLVWLIYRLFSDQLGANPIETITRTNGDWALRFLLITLAVTPLKLVTGQPQWLQLRRMLGLFAFFYACLHLLSYVVLDQFFYWPEIWADIIKRPYITVGMLSFLGLLPLVFTSTRAMRRRLGKKWDAIHSFIYPISAGAVIHFLWMVKADHREPLLYGSILLFLLIIRLVADIRKQLFPIKKQG